MVEIKQYGLQRSGTNFLRVILQENFAVSVLTNVGGWKHGFYELPRQLGRELDCVISVKDPYAWLVSFYHHRYREAEIGFAEFVSQPLTVVVPDVPSKTITSPSPIRHWMRMNEHWLKLRLREHRQFLFRYEDLLRDPVAALQPLVQELRLPRRTRWGRRLVQALGFARSEPQLFIPKVKLGAFGETYKKKHLHRGCAFDAMTYAKRKYLKMFTPELIEQVNAELDLSYVEELGYQMLTPADIEDLSDQSPDDLDDSRSSAKVGNTAASRAGGA